MSLKLNSSGGGSVTLQEPSTASNRTLTLPDNTGNLISSADSGTVAPAMLSTGAPSWNSSGVLSFNSGYGSVATAYGCRAWVNFNGTGTVAIRASGNVTSITDNGVGFYAVNFTTNMPDVNYCTNVTGSNSGGDGRYGAIDVDYVTNGQTVSTVGVSSANGSGVRTDAGIVCVAVFR